MNKVLAIRYGLRCLTCGLLSLLPVFGIPFAIAAVVFHVSASGYAPDDWNIARRYGLLGMFFAALGLVLNVTGLIWLAWLWLKEEF